MPTDEEERAAVIARHEEMQARAAGIEPKAPLTAEERARLLKETQSLETALDRARDASIVEIHRGLQGKAAKIVNECEATGEPIFVFRAKDMLSLFVLVHYEGLVYQYTANAEQEQMIRKAVSQFQAWQRENPDKLRFPD